MTVILPGLKSNYLIFDILAFTDCIRAYIIMRSLSRKAQSKVHLLIDFVVPHMIWEDRIPLEKLKKLAQIRTLIFPIIIDIDFRSEILDSIINTYPCCFFNIGIISLDLIRYIKDSNRELRSRFIGLRSFD